jgi:PAS domain S-box-containing protein
MANLSQTPISILYVDDDADTRLAFHWLFRSAGFRVKEAATGREALRLAAEKPDLVILDVNLPDINGIEVCKRIKAHPATASIPVLHLSAYFLSGETKAQALEGGADGYLTKPVEPHELLAQVKALLRVRQAEEAARASARQWQAVFDALPDGVCLFGPDGKVQRCNRAMAELLHRPVADVLGQPYHQLVREALGAPALSFFTPGRELNNRETVELPLGPRWFRVTADPLCDEHGHTVGGVHLFADITERKQLEGQLRQAQKLEALGRLAGGVAHDFNNLLVAITGNVGLVLAALPPADPHREVLGIVEKVAWRAAELARQLLGFSRRSTFRLKPLDLNRCAEEVVTVLRRTIDPRVTFEVRAAPGLWPAQADPGSVNQVLLNLAVNACDAMPEGGLLVLETANVVVDPAAARRRPGARAGEFVRVRVGDTGPGIPADILPRIFDPFFTTKEAGKGTGLGLAQVQSIVRQHRGWIECSSRVGVGAVFDVYLPRAQQGRAVAAEPAPPEVTRGGWETILLVDDTPAIRDLGRAVLQNYGYRVLLAEDGRQALDVYRREQDRIDLVVLDLTMPILSGRDTLRGLVRINPKVRVLFTSGFSAEYLPEADAENVVGFLPKPFRVQDLANAIRTVLDQEV